MARHTFGQSLTDFTITVGADATPLLADGAVEITFWNAATDGLQYLSLLNGSGAEVSSITSSDGTDGLPVGTIPQFQGPDGDVAGLWADAGGGARFKMIATDLGDALTDIADNTNAVAALTATVSGLAVVASTGLYSDLGGRPDLADVATSGDWADLDGAPAPGMQYVTKVGGSWPTRVATAPDTARPAMWIGPAPAPISGSGYALDGDLWVATP